FATAAGRCHPLTVLDDHSRSAVGLFACADQRRETVQARLAEAFRRYGLPLRVLCDNGPPWGSAESPYTELGVWLLRLGVGVGHGRPYHPQTQGKDERFHRTLDVEVLQGQQFAGLAACQGRFDGWRAVYNHERPHEALGLAVPASRYRVSPRPFPEGLPPLDYHASDAVRRGGGGRAGSDPGRPVGGGGGVSGEARVGVRATAEDGVWAVFFGVHGVASIDLRGNNQPD